MIYTFYSYKGGVGRSMAMANIAQWFYLQGKRVVMIDWDLEAPGIEGYFYSDEEKLNSIRSKDGLIDMLDEYKSGYSKLHTEISKSDQEVDGLVMKLLDELQQPDIDWTYIEETLHKHALLERQEVQTIEQEINALTAKGETTIPDIVKIFRQRISDSSTVNTISLNINSRIQQGCLDVGAVGVYLSTYSLFRKADIAEIVAKLKELEGNRDTTETQVFKILSEYLPGKDSRQDGQSDMLNFCDLKRFLQPIYPPASYNNNTGASLWLLSAGARSNEKFTSYVRKVQDFNWTEFYISYNGEAFFEHFRQQLESYGDIILIDSRTGVSEMSGVSTRQLADAIIIITAPNHQNLAGAANMVASFVNEDVKKARKGRELKVLLIPSRIDLSESLLLNKFQAEFHRTLESALPQSAHKMFWELGIPYIPYYNYTEELSVGLSDRPEDLESTGRSPVLDQAYRKLAAFILDGNIAAPQAAPEKSDRPDKPYVGLRAYQGQEAPLFFGRTLEIKRMYDIVVAKKFLILNGPSGSGKTSALYAGLMPALAGNSSFANHVKVSARPGAYPFYSLAGSIVTEATHNDAKIHHSDKSNELVRLLTDTPERLKEHIKSVLGEERPFIFVIDQFEEVFTLCQNEKERDNFINALGNWVANKLAIVIISIRSDFLKQLQAYPTMASAGEQAIVTLSVPSEGELKQIITEPATRAGLKFEQGLVERILKDLEGVNNRLPLLQITLNELWVNRQGSTLTHAAYDKFNRIDGILRRSFESVYKIFSAEELAAARPFLTHLVNVKTGTRQPLQLGVSDKDVKQVLRPFMDHGLVRITVDERTGVETLDLVHDVLITSWPQLLDWMNKDHEFHLWRQEIRPKVEAWQRSRRKDDLLVNRAAIKEAEESLKHRRADLLQSEQEFISNSIALRKQTVAQRLVQYGVLGIAAAIVIWFVFINPKLAKQQNVNAVLADSAGQSEAYLLVADFSAADRKDDDLALLQRYHRLQSKYKDKLKYIQTELEQNVGYNFFGVIDTFYSSLTKKTFNANTFFADSIIAFGELRGLTRRDMQNRMDSILEAKNIKNESVDSTYSFRSDSTGFYVSYIEKGNILIDKLEEYNSVNNSVEVLFDSNFQIRSYKYKVNEKNQLITQNIYADLLNRMRIDLFFCNDLSVKAKRTGNAIGRMLKDTKEFNVNNKTFRNPPDSNSPYYVSGNEIRFFRADAKEREQAQHIRDLIKSKTGLEFDLKEVGMRTPGIISIFMCSN